MLTIEIKRAGYNALTVTCQPGTTVESLLRTHDVEFGNASIRFNGDDASPSYRLNSSGEIRLLKNVKGN